MGIGRRHLRPAVFLDRDGVINEAPVVGGQARSPRTAADLRLLPGVPDALRRLRARGFVLVVVTNQPDIAHGRVAAETVHAMHASLLDALPLDSVYLCPHDHAAGCECRKPRSGMLRTAAEAHDIDLRRSWMVGDRWVDIAAGAAAGTRTILVEADYNWLPTSSGPPPADLRPDATAADLPGAVELLLSADGPATT